MLPIKRSPFKKILLVCVIIGIPLVITYNSFFKSTINLNMTNENHSTTSNMNYSVKSVPKYVLYWSPFWKTWDYYMGYGYKPFENCKFKNCFATKNRSMIPLQNFDALIFHTSYNKQIHGVPRIRSHQQKYIFMNMEAPIYVGSNLKQYEFYFNWTMTYRFDSDIVRRHGYVIQEVTNYTMPSLMVLKNKTKLAAWMVSHCNTASHREKLTQEIQKLMPVDVYGNCGKLKCPKNLDNNKTSSPECYDIIEQNYKFYFSFENSYCKDYSTEKLYNILRRNVVPVVYGFGDYNISAPPNSVINAADFESVENLVSYLKYLDQNITEYLKYFEWKTNYRIVTSSVVSSCQICQKLNECAEQSVYYDLDGWLRGKNNSICQTNKILPKIVSDLLLNN